MSKIEFVQVYFFNLHNFIEFLHLDCVFWFPAKDEQLSCCNKILIYIIKFYLDNWDLQLSPFTVICKWHFVRQQVLQRGWAIGTGSSNCLQFSHHVESAHWLKLELSLISEIQDSHQDLYQCLSDADTQNFSCRWLVFSWDWLLNWLSFPYLRELPWGDPIQMRFYLLI